MKKIIISVVSMALLSGCAGMRSVNSNTPHTSITGTVAGQPFDIENPKDTILDGLTVTAATNGTVSIHIDHLSTVMNPTNINATGDAGEKMITATGNAISQGIQTSAQAAGAFAGAAAKTAIVAP